jgi:hypothetical protein
MSQLELFRGSCGVMLLAYWVVACGARSATVEYGGKTYSQPGELAAHCMQGFMQRAARTNKSFALTAAMEPELAASESCMKRVEDFGHVDITRSQEQFVHMLHEISVSLTYVSFTEEKEIRVIDRAKACEHLSQARASGEDAKKFDGSVDISSETAWTELLHWVDLELSACEIFLRAFECSR